METKVCKECGRELPVENFHKGRAKGVLKVSSLLCQSAMNVGTKDKLQDAGKPKKSVHPIKLIW